MKKCCVDIIIASFLFIMSKLYHKMTILNILFSIPMYCFPKMNDLFSRRISV